MENSEFDDFTDNQDNIYENNEEKEEEENMNIYYDDKKIKKRCFK